MVYLRVKINFDHGKKFDSCFYKYMYVVNVNKSRHMGVE